jgi:plastocyanin
MKRLLILFCLLALNHAMGGTIRGTVHAEGKPGTDDSDAGGKYDSRKYKFVERMDYSAMHDFVVYIDGPVAGAPTAPAKPIEVVTRRVAQQGAAFNPSVLPVEAGTTVEWPNNDDIFHNVFSDSEAKQFDLGLYKGNPKEKAVTFDKPGRVDVFCSIHASMHCTVMVLENPYFAVSDTAGKFVITNVPAGTYKLKAWHDRLPVQTQEITVPADGDVKINFTLGINNLPKY